MDMVDITISSGHGILWSDLVCSTKEDRTSARSKNQPSRSSGRELTHPFLTTDERPVFAPDGLRTGGVCFFGLELEFPIFDSRLTACGEISVPFYSQSILQEFEKSVG